MIQNITKYLADNKEWIFSGIGILALTSLFAVFKILFFSNKKNSSTTMKQINRSNLSNPELITPSVRTMETVIPF